MNIFDFLIFFSCIILYGFIFISVLKFGQLPSYSAYSTKWIERYPNWKVKIWYAITLIAAFLIIPSMIQAGVGNKLQFLGFFAPAYLIGVAHTPNWETDASEHKLHMIFAVLCAVAGICWSIFVAHTWCILLFNIIIVLIASLLSKTFKDSKVFWGELIAFNTVYMSLAMIF